MDVETLRSIKKVVTHRSSATTVCHDGMAAAMIVSDALPQVEVVFCQYNTTEHRALVPEPGVLFVDFTPYAERSPDPPHALTERGLKQARAWVDEGAVVLDHHRGAADLVALFGERGVFADEAKEPGVSGAELARREVWVPIKGSTSCDQIEHHDKIVELFALQAGVRDTWQREHPLWRGACWQAAALCFWSPEVWLDACGVFERPDGEELVNDVFNVKQVGIDWREVLDKVEEIGEVLLAKQEVADDELAQGAYHFRVAGLNVACFQGSSREASDVGDLLAQLLNVDLALAWSYYAEEVNRLDGTLQQPRMRVSARSRGGFACDAFAKSYGGNGHKNSAGFVLDVGGSSMNPYTALHAAVIDYTAGAVRRST